MVDIGTVVDAYHVDGSGLLVDAVDHPVRPRRAAGHLAYNTT